MTTLHHLTNSPRQFPDCCASLSRPLIATLLSILPPTPSLTLSIGCGSGLLEHLLESGAQPLNLHGIEVPTCQVSHLPPDRILRVPSSRSVHPLVPTAKALMFVYPRMPELVRWCVDQGVAGGVLERVVWLGARSDWADYVDVMAGMGGEVEVVEQSGVVEYEVLAVATVRR